MTLRSQSGLDVTIPRVKNTINLEQLLIFVIMQTLITGLFHLVMELADDAIGWVGGIGRQNIGRDAEGKMHNLFMAGGRFGANGVDRMKIPEVPKSAKDK